MAALPYMQFYVSDYLADTMHLSAEQHGAYLLLIFNYWQTGKPLPADPSRLARIARVTFETWQEIEMDIEAFFIQKGDFWVHPRIEADLEYVQKKQDQAAIAGKASAKARAAMKVAKANARSTDVQTPVPTDVGTDDATPVPTGSQREGNEAANEIDPDPDPDNRSKRSAPKKFIKPTIDEIKNYCTERSNKIDAELFFDYYEANGWKVGRNAMKDWKAAIRNWEKRNEENPRTNRTSNAQDNFTQGLKDLAGEPDT